MANSPQFILKDFMYLFLERDEGREKERKRNIYVQCVREAWLVSPGMPSSGDLAWNPGMCPDQESNQQPASLLDGAQLTEIHQSGLPRFLITLESLLLYAEKINFF